MTGEQFLDYMADLQPPKTKKVRLELTKQFKANTHKRLSDLSKGNRQKIGIIQAFMHEPDLLILDEPTDGLDPLMQENFYSIVKARQRAGATVFVSSHNLAEVQKMCDRVGIIRDGKLVRETTIATLATEAAQTFEVTFVDKVPLKSIKAVAGVREAKIDNGITTIHVHGNLKPFLMFLSKQNISALSTKSLKLEEEFMRYYQTGAKK
jgi:ABC-2 type transport system ATP-binding protein